MSSVNRRVQQMAAVLVLCLAATPLRAQTAPSLVQGSEPSPTGLFALPVEDEQVITQPAGPAPTPRHTGIKAMVKGLGTDVKHLPSRQNLFVAGVGGVLALAAHPFDLADDAVDRRLRCIGTHHDNHRQLLLAQKLRAYPASRCYSQRQSKARGGSPTPKSSSVLHFQPAYKRVKNMVAAISLTLPIPGLNNPQ